MAGQEDWKQISINGFQMWGHVPCGLIIMQDSTLVHEPLCPAKGSSS